MRFLKLVIMFVLWASAVSADRFSVGDLRAAVQKNDFEAVDSGLAQAQDEFLEGQRTADDIRELYIAISRSAPDVVEFVKTWVRRDPDNHRAQIARAWSLYNGANFIRRANNAQAYEVSAQMYKRVRLLAAAAYDANPDLMPAADAIIRDLGREVPPIEALAHVLPKHPNYGSIQRYIPQLRTYTAEVIKKFCAGFAEDFQASEAKIVEHRCLLDSALHHGHIALREYGKETLWTVTYSEVALQRLAFFIRMTDHREWSDEQIEWATDLLMNHPMDQFQVVPSYHLAKTLSHILTVSFQRTNLIEEEFKRRRYADVSGFLAHDPYNLDLIELAAGVEFDVPSRIVKDAEGKSRIETSAIGITKAENAERRAAKAAQRLDFAKRRLLSSPYNDEFWVEYANLARLADYPYSMFDGDAALINAIVVSDDPATHLRQFLNSKTEQYKHFVELAELPKEDWDRLPNWQHVMNNTNIARQVLCPALRAKILHEAVCEYYDPNSAMCQPVDMSLRANEEKMISTAKRMPECSGILAASSPQELWYEMIDFGEAMVHLP